MFHSTLHFCSMTFIVLWKTAASVPSAFKIIISLSIHIYLFAYLPSVYHKVKRQVNIYLEKWLIFCGMLGNRNSQTAFKAVLYQKEIVWLWLSYQKIPLCCFHLQIHSFATFIRIFQNSAKPLCRWNGNRTDFKRNWLRIRYYT